MWVLVIKLGSSDFPRKCIYPRSHLASHSRDKFIRLASVIPDLSHPLHFPVTAVMLLDIMSVARHCSEYVRHTNSSSSCRGSAGRRPREGSSYYSGLGDPTAGSDPKIL